MGRTTPGLESTAPWLALLAAFSPVLVDLARNLAEDPKVRVTLLAPLLLLLALRERPAEAAPSQRDGAVAIAIGVALEMLGIATRSWSIARLGLPVAALGLARWMGRPPGVSMALLFFAIPLPDSVVSLPSPALEAALARAAAAILRVPGASVEAIGLSLVAPAGRIDLLPVDGGASLAVALGALGWYSAARVGAGVGLAVLRAALACLLAMPLQLLALLVTGVLLAVGLRDAGELWLRQGAWIALGGLGLLWLQRHSTPARLRGAQEPRC